MLHQAPRLFLALLALAAIPSLIGCSRQKEGERCSHTNGNSDCEDNLECTNLGTNTDGKTVYRCCPEAGETSTDERCQAVTGGEGGSGTGGGGGVGGVSGDGDEPVGQGDNCTYNSDCVAPLVCAPGGKCALECLVSRDCDDGESCVENSCVAD